MMIIPANYITDLFGTNHVDVCLETY